MTAWEEERAAFSSVVGEADPLHHKSEQKHENAKARLKGWPARVNRGRPGSERPGSRGRERALRASPPASAGATPTTAQARARRHPLPPSGREHAADIAVVSATALAGPGGGAVGESAKAAE